jgi:hypothetical protein
MADRQARKQREAQWRARDEAADAGDAGSDAARDGDATLEWD